METVKLAVVGAHLKDMPLHWQLTSRDASFVGAFETAPTYRLYAMADSVPPKPALVHSADGASIAVEVYELDVAAFGSFVVEVPRPAGDRHGYPRRRNQCQRLRRRAARDRRCRGHHAAGRLVRLHRPRLTAFRIGWRKTCAIDRRISLLRLTHSLISIVSLPYSKTREQERF